MLITLIVALVIVWITQRKRNSKPSGKKVSFFQKHRALIFVVILVTVPIILLNYFRPVVHVTDPGELVDLQKAQGTDYQVLNAYEYNAYSYPDSIPLLFEYIEQLVAYGNFDGVDLLDKVFSNDPKTQGLAMEYADALCSDFSFKDTTSLLVESIPKIDLNGTTRFHNYVLAAYAINSQNPKEGKAELLWLNEIQINPSYSPSYENLYYYYYIRDSDKFERFITNSNVAEHLASQNLRRDYFLLGEYGLFFEVIYHDRFVDLSIMALLAGLLISFVWLYFLRETDFFDKERWFDMLLVFFGGAIFSHLCLFVYSYAQQNLGLTINGEGWNDFLYCSGVIGFGEELVKLIPWLIFVLLSKRVNEPFDYILYASVSALGFAFAENLMYLENTSNIVPRSIMSTLGHMFFATIIAYAVILAKYKYTQPVYKILLPLAGFIIACLAHGFYDFWLISPAFQEYALITTVFFILSVHVWFYMINNATNHSQFFSGRLVNAHKTVDILNYGFIAIMMLQFIFISIEFGAQSANFSISHSMVMPVIFMVYIAVLVVNIKPQKGIWHAYRLPNWMLISKVLSFDTSIANPEGRDHLGLKLKLFTAKSNRYIGSILPISGSCTRHISVNGQEGWYVFELSKSIGMAGHLQHQVLIKTKSTSQALTMDKVEIYLMLIPAEHSSIPDNLAISKLSYTGRVFARLID
ncbi:MAG: RsiW-degrading membrane proteinase PrsW (M82 family) [Flavobacteriaceae bacterium]|jgi:RsiW-degrading membrane proteinase PrsW (M82 family)